MIFDLLDSSLDGDLWEELIVKCYKLKYNDQHFTPIPAEYQGDGGIEGFTKSGVAIQCYCPNDSNLSNDKLHEKLRIKMTNDINKFINVDYISKLKKLGIPIIKEWHFVIPEYRDKRIIEHAAKKKELVLSTKEKDLQLYDYISEDFDIIIKVADDYMVELSTIVRSKITNVKLNIVLNENSKPNWTSCDIDKINNVKRKLIAIQPDLSNYPDQFNELLDMYMTFYMLGIEQLERLNDNFPDIRKDILELTSSFRSEVTIKTLFNTDKTLNSKLFIELGETFEKNLRRDFDFLSSASIMNLKNNIVASWLADCSMEFKGDI